MPLALTSEATLVKPGVLFGATKVTVGVSLSTAQKRDATVVFFTSSTAVTWSW